MRTIDELGISKTPWSICDFSSDHIGVASSSGRRVADVSSTVNARLIVAAPELYECLRMAYLHMIGEYDYDGCEAKRFEDALAKASGEEVK